ncbi:MAG: hypothetical protein WC747_01570 [Candidatus Babeliales bacterium]
MKKVSSNDSKNMLYIAASIGIIIFAGSKFLNEYSSFQKKRTMDNDYRQKLKWQHECAKEHKTDVMWEYTQRQIKEIRSKMLHDGYSHSAIDKLDTDTFLGVHNCI